MRLRDRRDRRKPCTKGFISMRAIGGEVGRSYRFVAARVAVHVAIVLRSVTSLSVKDARAPP